MKKTRGQNEGSIKKRADGRWEARVMREDGTRKSFYCKTRQEAASRLTEALGDIKKGLPIVDESQTVEEYLLSWVDAMKHTVKPRTWKYYKDYVRLHAIPLIGKVKLGKLKAQDIQSLYTRKLNQGLSSTTVNHLHAVLHKALNNAFRLGLVQRNITDMVDHPRMAHHEIAPLTAEQVGAFLTAATGERLEALYVLAVTTGMREGELLALTWRDIDFEKSRLQVRATLQFLEGKFVFTEPKTAGSRRNIGLPKITVEALRQHRLRQNEERALLEDNWDTSHDLIFPNTVGKPINATNLIKRGLKPLLKKAGVPPIRFHDLRHTAATLLLSKGVNVKVVSEMLGHADVTTTLRIYAHVLPHMQQTATDTMDVLFRDQLHE